MVGFAAAFAAALADTVSSEIGQLSEKELQLLYQGHVMKSHGRLFWLVDYYLVWGGIVFLFLTGYVATLIRVRKKRKLLELEEKCQDEQDFTGEGSPRAS